jgi:lipopolysaccharide heptosyltransferase II
MKISTKNIKNILIIRSGAVGDLIMATPLIKNIREDFPSSKISFLVGKWSKNVLNNNPNIDEIIEFEDEIIAKKKIFNVLALVSRLRRKKFDSCFILDKSWMWNLFAFLCGIKKRIGFSRGNEGAWNSVSVQFDGSKHEIEYNLELIKKIGANAKYYQPELYATKEDKEFASSFVKRISKKIERIIGICPGGASNPGQVAFIKRWPVEKYIELANELNSLILVFGGKEDKSIAEHIITNSKNKNIYDATGISLQQTKEIMEKCDFIVSHDSGGMHIASTTRAKLVALFGPTPPNRLCPKNAILVQAKCAPCYGIYGKYKEGCDKDCMNSISVEEVKKKIV